MVCRCLQTVNTYDLLKRTVLIVTLLALSLAKLRVTVSARLTVRVEVAGLTVRLSALPRSKWMHPMRIQARLSAVAPPAELN